MSSKAAETPKATTPAVAENTTKSTPVNDRKYSLVAEPSIAPKGKQRQIVIAALKSHKGPMTVEQVIDFATKNGLTAVGGVAGSCRYHLHHLVKLNIAKVENPTVMVEKKADAEKKTA
jgi:hypothetical protein